MCNLTTEQEKLIRRIRAGRINIFKKNPAREELEDIRREVARYCRQVQEAASIPLGSSRDGVFDHTNTFNHVYRGICRLVIEARRRNQIGVLVFGQDIVLVARPRCSSVAMQAEIMTLILQWQNEMREQHQRYENSPAGRRAAQKAEKLEREKGHKARALIEELPTVNVDDLNATIQWLARMVALDCYISPEDTQGVIEHFSRHHPFLPMSDEAEVPWLKSRDRAYFGRMLVRHLLTEVQHPGSFQGLRVDVKRWNKCFTKY